MIILVLIIKIIDNYCKSNVIINVIINVITNVIVNVFINVIINVITNVIVNVIINVNKNVITNVIIYVMYITSLKYSYPRVNTTFFTIAQKLLLLVLLSCRLSTIYIRKKYRNSQILL